MKTLLLLFVFCLSKQLLAQSFDNELVLKYDFDNSLSILKGVSHIQKYKQIDTIFLSVPSHNHIKRTVKEFIVLYKDQELNVIKHEVGMINKPHEVIEESFDLFEWKLSEERKNIIGFPCYKATASFRGRDYVAWYTTRLELKGSPWKFCGLPGTIISVESVDGVIKFEVTEIRVRRSQPVIHDPFYKEKTISWEQYKKALSITVEELKVLTQYQGLSLSGGTSIEKFYFSER